MGREQSVKSMLERMHEVDKAPMQETPLRADLQETAGESNAQTYQPRLQESANGSAKARLAMLENPKSNKDMVDLLEYIAHAAKTVGRAADHHREYRNVYQYSKAGDNGTESESNRAKALYLEMGDDLAGYCAEFINKWNGKKTS